MFKKSFSILPGIAIVLVLIPYSSYAKTEEAESWHIDEHYFCHRCGMAIEKSDRVITVVGVLEEQKPWHQCCPMCALMDMVECGGGKGKIVAYCDNSGEKIEITVNNKRIEKMFPDDAILLVGGSCPKNKVFYSKQSALEFIKGNSWATEEMLKSVPEALDTLKKVKPFERCSMCAAELKGHERTWFTIITKDKKRMLACCGHCGLFMMYKLKDEAMRAVTPDFKTGRMIDAKQAYYVAGNDLILCCVPSTVSFKSKADATEFQEQHGGEILTFQEAMGNIEKIMKKSE